VVAVIGFVQRPRPQRTEGGETPVNAVDAAREAVARARIRGAKIDLDAPTAPVRVASVCLSSTGILRLPKPSSSTWARTPARHRSLMASTRRTAGGPSS